MTFDVETNCMDENFWRDDFLKKKFRMTKNKSHYIYNEKKLFDPF